MRIALEIDPFAAIFAHAYATTVEFQTFYFLTVPSEVSLERRATSPPYHGTTCCSPGTDCDDIVSTFVVQ